MKGINVLLSRTEGPINLGFIARAMANTGFSSLSYTGEIPKHHPKALKYALHAENILSSAVHASSFEELISKSDILIGFTPRAPFENSLQFEELRTYTGEKLSEGLTVGLLFGNEASGLNNNEAAACTRTVALPTSEEYASMNLAQAVMVTLWELRDTPSISAEPSEKADRKTKDTLINVVSNHLELIEYFNGQNPDPIKQEINQIFETKDLSKREAEILISVFGKSISRYRHLLKNSK
ncbi:MAG: RNA methyltransferase [Deferribacterales bacterium]